MRRLCLARQQVQPHPNPVNQICHKIGTLTFESKRWMEERLKKTRSYIMNTFKSRDHSINISSTLNTPVNTSIGHLSYHLKIIAQTLGFQEVTNISNNMLYSVETRWTCERRTNLLDRLIIIFWIHTFCDTKVLGCRNLKGEQRMKKFVRIN